MTDKRLRNIDLNLLKVFLALHEERSVTAVGERLGLAQSSVSHSLTRLRRMLEDPLFVRDANGMQPTPFAQAIAGPIGAALTNIDTAINRAQDFNPAVTRREFNLMMTDMGEQAFVPPLMRHLRIVAPGLTIRVHQRPRSNYCAALESGEADLALGQLPEFSSGLHLQHLRREYVAFAARDGHPIGGTITMDELMRADHLVVNRGMIEIRIARALGKRAAERNIVLRTDNYLTAPSILLATDLIGALPRSLVENWPGLKILSVPLKVDPIELVQFWHSRIQSDDACKWLRKTIFELFRRD